MSIIAKDMQVFEILEAVDKAVGNEAKFDVLAKYRDHTPARNVLLLAFADNIVSVLPEGEPPFTKQESDGPARASLWNYASHFPRFVRSQQSQQMKMLQIERIFIEMLEAIDVKEAELFCIAKDKKLHEKYDISAELVDAVWPGVMTSSSVKAKELTDEEKAEKLLAQAESMKSSAKEYQDKAKELNAEAKKLQSDAKELLKEAK